MIEGNAEFSITIDKGAFDALVGAFQSRVAPAVERAMYREMERIVAAARERVPVDLNALRASGTVDPPTREGSMVVVRGSFGRGPSAGYAIYVHEGTGPAVGRSRFTPPYEPGTPLGAWAARHGVDDARALARLIGSRGLAPRKFLEAPLNEARAGMDERLAADIGMDLSGTM